MKVQQGGHGPQGGPTDFQGSLKMTYIFKLDKI